MCESEEPYQILTEDGTLQAGETRPDGLTDDRLRALYRTMVLNEELDRRMMKLQRQGRVDFYGEARGQYAGPVGSAAVLQDQDWIFPALREPAAALLRGFPLKLFIAQVFGTDPDVCRGRQMPCHYSYADGRYVSMSSNIGTQLPHATGAGWAAKIQDKDEVTMGYLGDGATSEGDFHVALNFAGVYDVPVVFFCQNNQFAISVPADRQTDSDSFAIKSKAYGFPGERIDGNDLFAVYETTRRAVERARNGEGPTLIESVTYRIGAHSSSDDPSRYRDESITEEWEEEKDPIDRVRSYMISEGIWSEQREENLRDDVGKKIKETIEEVEAAPDPPVKTMFEDVYADMPDHLREQMERHLQMPE